MATTEIFPPTPMRNEFFTGKRFKKWFWKLTMVAMVHGLMTKGMESVSYTIVYFLFSLVASRLNNLVKKLRGPWK